MAKQTITPDEHVAAELTEMKGEIEQLEATHAALSAKLAKVNAELEQKRDEWDEKVEELGDPWKSLLSNKLARTAVPTTTKSAERVKFTKWLKDTLHEAGGSMNYDLLKAGWEKQSGMGTRFVLRGVDGVKNDGNKTVTLTE